MRNLLILLAAVLLATLPAVSQDSSGMDTKSLPDGIGDRIHYNLSRSESPDPAVRAPVRIDSGYRIGVGDTISLRVRGNVDLRYGKNEEPSVNEVVVNRVSRADADTYEVMPDGAIQLPLLGSVEAAGKTVDELQRDVTSGLSKYFKHFTVDLKVLRPGLKRVWVGGQVGNPGPLTLTPTATVLEALLEANILPEGSTRAVQLRRDGETKTVDAYGVVALGDLESNLLLETGDEIFVPSATDWVTVSGEVSRSGKFEMCSRAEGTRVRDLVSLCLGLLPTAAPAHAMIARPGASGKVTAVHVDLTADDNPELKPGDNLIIPSVTDYQPTIRLVGEFKGDGVYQRVSEGAILNKSGVYKLAAGETVGDVIRRTGGTTPQANLKRARVQRRNEDKLEVIPVDLERVLIHQDRSADVVLRSGDTVELPALVDKVYVFGQVPRPGGVSYEPDRRMLDYLAGAGGPSTRAKSSILLIRGGVENPDVTKVNLTRGMKGEESDNPIMQPGDVIYIPQDAVKDWRDVAQIISAVRLLTLF